MEVIRVISQNFVFSLSTLDSFLKIKFQQNYEPLGYILRIRLRHVNIVKNEMVLLHDVLQQQMISAIIIFKKNLFNNK